MNPVASATAQDSDTEIVLEGLRPGAEYFLAAWYVKDTGDGRPDATTRAPWDSWGYYCNLTHTNALQIAGTYGFDPVAVAAVEDDPAVRAIWLQDTDFNDNVKADREEDFLDIPAFYDRELVVGYGKKINGGVPRGGSSSTSGEKAEVMAFAKVPYELVAVTNMADGKVEIKWYAIVPDPSSTSVDGSGVAVGTPLSELSQRSDLKLASVYLYGDELALGSNVTFSADSPLKVTGTRVEDLVLVHAQVLDRFGFDPATANGSLAALDRVNSKEVTTDDKGEYLKAYLENVLGATNVSAYVLGATGDDDPVEGGRGDGLADLWEGALRDVPAGRRAGRLDRHR